MSRKQLNELTEEEYAALRNLGFLFEFYPDASGIWSDDCKINIASQMQQRSKYHRVIKGVSIDVYDVLDAFEVTNPATAHAVKKLLMPGNRGYKDTVQDLTEAKASIDRAIELEKEVNEKDD